jgi:hypothetical protein
MLDEKNHNPIQSRRSRQFKENQLTIQSMGQVDVAIV